MTHDDAWDYIGRLYARPGAAQALIARQDSEGLDVVLHLFARWAEHAGKPLDAAAWAEADALVRRWREEVVRPLRAVRRTIQGMGTHAAGLAPVLAEAKAAELAAERAQLQQLCDWLASR